MQKQVSYYYHFFRYENPRRKNFISPSCTKHPKITNWNKKWHKFFIFTLLCDASIWKQKVYIIFPAYSWLGQQVLRLCFCQTPNLCHFIFLNNRDTLKQNMKDKNKTSLLAHYSNLFLAHNSVMFFIIPVHNILLRITKTLFQGIFDLYSFMKSALLKKKMSCPGLMGVTI